MIAKIIVSVDNLLYNTIGIVTPFRRAYWKRRSSKVQRDLNIEHSKRDYINATHCSNYTTKKALEIYDAENCL